MYIGVSIMKKNKKTKNKKEWKDMQPFSLWTQIKTNRTAYIVYLSLSSITLFIMVRCVINQQWENLFVCFLAFILYMIPPFVEKNLKVELPTTLECLAFFFVFCAEVLGEISAYYIKFPIWDTLLHTINGFMFAAFGFCLVDILNKRKKFRFVLSPLYMALVSFCFSMTIGVLWEFLEFGIDNLFSLDMQKDYIVQSVYSVSLDPTRNNVVIPVKDIIYTTIQTANGETIVLNGYLDLGLYDTMKDLIVNFIGAIIFSVIGYFYVKQRGKGKIANQFIPVAIAPEKEKLSGCADKKTEQDSSVNSIERAEKKDL